MPIISTEIQYLLSGGAANADPNLSLGGIVSTTAVPSNYFDKVDSAQALSGETNYRCFYVKNTNATLTLTGARVWIALNTTSADTDINIGLGTSAINATEQTIANEATAPTSVVFSAAATEGASLLIGDLAPNQTKAVWLRRIVNANAAASNDTYTLRVKGDTLP